MSADDLNAVTESGLSGEALETERTAQRALAVRTNWGRWGADDQRGALNTVTAQAVMRGIAAVKHGRVIPLSPVLKARSDATSGGATAIHFMGMDGGDFAAGAGRNLDRQFAIDTFILAVHGATTHLDGLAHVWTDGKMYNDNSGNLVRSWGARRLGIEHFGGVVTRGVFLDVAAKEGLDCLPPTYLITAKDVRECEQACGVEITEGDAVIIRTGWPLMAERDPVAFRGVQPGVGSSAGEYLAERDICLVGADNGAVQAAHSYGHDAVAEAADPRSEIADIHIAFLRNLGIYLLEMMDLSQLHESEVHEFLFALAPLRVQGATGSPVNPLAVI
jgi:kynurenine formamidase